MPAPRITGTHLRQALATRAGVVVQDQRDGVVYALPQGMTKTQSMDGDLVVVLTNDEAAWFVQAADGKYPAAAKTATAIRAWEIEQIEANLARWAAQAAS